MIHPTRPGRFARLADRLQEPVDIAPLVYFRLLFGAIMLWEVYRYFSKGWIARYFIKPTMHPATSASSG